jgi:hypothetical protein
MSNYSYDESQEETRPSRKPSQAEGALGWEENSPNTQTPDQAEGDRDEINESLEEEYGGKVENRD